MMKRVFVLFILACASIWMAGCGTTPVVPVPPASQSQVAYLEQAAVPLSAKSSPRAPGTSDAKLMIMNSDGTEKLQVGTAAPFAAVDLSHDGTKVATTVYDVELGTRLLVGSSSTGTLTDITPDGVIPEMPEFSPDGTKVYFVNIEPYPWEIWSVSPNGTDATNLNTVGDYCMHEMTIAPDGKIYFHGHSEIGSDSGIYVMNANGSGVTLVISEEEVNMSAYHPAISGDGATLVFEGSGDGSAIYKATVNGSNLTQLTTGGNEEDPIVVGDKVLYINSSDGVHHVYSMNLDGTAKTPLANTTAENWFGTYAGD